MKTLITRHTLVLLLVNDHVSVEAVSVLEYLIALVASVLRASPSIGQGGGGNVRHDGYCRRPEK